MLSCSTATRRATSSGELAPLTLISVLDSSETAPPAEFFAHPQHARTRRFLQKVLDPLHQESIE